MSPEILTTILLLKLAGLAIMIVWLVQLIRGGYLARADAALRALLTRLQRPKR